MHRASRRGSRAAALLPASLLVAALAAVARDARATSGDGAGAGPVLGVTWNGSVSLGWELGGSLGALGPISRASIGGSYQLSRAGSDPAAFHYLAWEPWIYVGGTLGIAETNERDVRVLYGLWEGYALTPGSSIFDPEQDFFDDDTRFHWVLTFSIGWRGVGGSTQQLYFTPKLWHIKGWDFFT